MESIFGFVFELLIYGIAKILLPIVTFGKCRLNVEKSKSGAFSGWPLYTKGSDGIIYIGLELGILIGVIFWIILVVIVGTALAT